jgi:hypothetical protein
MWAREEISYRWEWARNGGRGGERNDFVMKMGKEANWVSQRNDVC